MSIGGHALDYLLCSSSGQWEVVGFDEHSNEPRGS
jgi:hypothetical protein